MKQRIRSRARDQPAVIEVIAIGEDFARNLQSDLFPCALHGAVRWCKQDQGRIDCEDRMGNGLGQFFVAHSHVVKRAMRLYMLRPSASGDREGMESADLIDQL